jgi:hypothetical protein
MSCVSDSVASPGTAETAAAKSALACSTAADGPVEIVPHRQHIGGRIAQSLLLLDQFGAARGAGREIAQRRQLVLERCQRSSPARRRPSRRSRP